MRISPGRWLFPLLGTAGLIAVGMATTIWLGPRVVGASNWSLPHDLWGTLVAAQRLSHLNLGGLYSKPTALVTLPGAAVILVPAAAVIDAAGLSLQAPGAQNPHPGAWLIAGPYEIAISAVALFAADALAGHLGAARRSRALLAAAGAVALWNVSVRWGHPEDAVAVGLLMFGVRALARARAGRSAWLAGAAIAVQPLVLLALPAILMLIQPKRLAGFLTRAALPGALLLGAAASANWHATWNAVTSQPNWPAVDHPTAWAHIAPHLGGGAVAAGPTRAVAIMVASGVAVLAGRGWLMARQSASPSPEHVRDMVWWAAVGLALRSVFEPVMAAYYVWPVLAAALVTASGAWRRLLATSAATTALTFASQVWWPNPLGWWTTMIAGLGVTLFLARVPLSDTAAVLGTGSPQAGRPPVPAPSPRDECAAAMAKSSRPPKRERSRRPEPGRG